MAYVIDTVDCPDCGSAVGRRGLASHMGSLVCTVQRDVRKFAVRGWLPVPHHTHQRAVRELNLGEWGAVSYHAGFQRRRAKLTESVYVPAWAHEILSIAINSWPLPRRVALLRFAVDRGLVDAIEAWYSAGGDPVELIQDHAAVHGVTL